MEKVKTWFMAQRLRCGISWSSEEIEETSSPSSLPSGPTHFKSLLFYSSCRAAPRGSASFSCATSEQVGLGIVPLTLSQPTQMKGLKVEPEEPLNHQKAKETLMALRSIPPSIAILAGSSMENSPRSRQAGVPTSHTA